jgi:AraC-like DNA-binding protein
MATREAIAGGVSPTVAYRMSDVYVNKIDQCSTIDDMMSYMRDAGGAFARRVAEVRAQKAVSNYTEQCKDYIYRNYHNKIYLEEVADAIGVSPGHLSRVFRSDTGMSIQDYIQKFRVERAANLLKYSEASLTEISDYVCFHSQSHFGNVFKRYMGMTPKQYREKYKEKEFQSKNKK